MKILGLSFDYHDAAATAVHDGQILAAAQEERFSRKKHDSSFPGQAIKFCLEASNWQPGDLDAVVYYEKPLLKFDRILYAVISDYPKNNGYFERTLNSWLQRKKLDVRGRISKALGISSEKIYFIEHHQAHAGAAFFCSPFDESTIVTIDGVGEYETLTVSLGKGTHIEKLYSTQLPNSLGLFYSAFTAFLGFEVNEGEYKVMGMAGFGEPVFAGLLRPFIHLRPDGRFEIQQDCFNFLCPETVPFTDKLIKLLGPPRIPESPFDMGDPGKPPEPGSVQENSRHYANIAASVQLVTEETMLHIVQKAIEVTGIKKVCMAGGVALNCVANGAIQRQLGVDLYVHPAAGDAGGAVGGALYYEHCLAGNPRYGALENVFLGKAYTEAEIDEVLRRFHISTHETVPDRHKLLAKVAEKLAAGAVVGWFQDRFEWGPRALGNRSILADPTRPGMKGIVNEKIKFREPFRPFAPAVLADRALDFFDIVEPYSLASPEHFMLSVGRVREEKKSIIPAVIHVDGTTRVQLVRQETNPLFYDLIKAFANITGVPVLLNTSFNLRGEPIVNDPWDAFKTFSWSDMDFLILGQVIVRKEALTCILC